MPVYAETCPQYLFLSFDDYERPEFEGAKYVMSPPLRTKESNDALWEGLRGGDQLPGAASQRHIDQLLSDGLRIPIQGQEIYQRFITGLCDPGARLREVRGRPALLRDAVPMGPNCGICPIRHPLACATAIRAAARVAMASLSLTLAIVCTSDRRARAALTWFRRMSRCPMFNVARNSALVKPRCWQRRTT